MKNNLVRSDNDNIYRGNNLDSSNIVKENIAPLAEEYRDYRNSLIFYKECAACHYAQGMVFLGLGFFTAIRMQFLWSTLKWRTILGYSMLSIISSSIGLYKFSYAYHIFQAQGKIKQIK